MRLVYALYIYISIFSFCRIISKSVHRSSSPLPFTNYIHLDEP